jgi:hypothetical protein
MFDIISMSAIFLIIVLMAIFRVPGRWDDTMHHLPLARFYVESGIVLNEYLRFPLVPQDMQMLFALGLMIGGDAAAQAMATIPIFMICLGLIGSGIWLLGSYPCRLLISSAPSLSPCYSRNFRIRLHRQWAGVV